MSSRSEEVDASWVCISCVLSILRHTPLLALYLHTLFFLQFSLLFLYKHFSIQNKENHNTKKNNLLRTIENMVLMVHHRNWIAILLLGGWRLSPGISRERVHTLIHIKQVLGFTLTIRSKVHIKWNKYLTKKKPSDFIL